MLARIGLHKCSFAAIMGASASCLGFRAQATEAGKCECNGCKPVVFCGPSGAGKSTLIKMLQKEFPEDFGFSVSHTTRAPRTGENNGIDYHFVKKEEIQAEIAKGLFIEHANVHGNIYGTSFAAVDDVTAKKQICILDIDVQDSSLDVGLYVFIAPPSLDELEARLRKRATDSAEAIALRLQNARREMHEAESIMFDFKIVNDDMEHAYERLRDALQQLRCSCAEERKGHHDE